MAGITSYAGLKTEIQNFINKSGLSADVDTFIDLAEAELAKSVRAQNMIVTASGTVSSNPIPISSSPFSWFQELRSLSIVVGGEDRVLNFISPDLFRGRYADVATGIPEFYTFMDVSLYLDPAPNDTFTYNAVYIQLPKPLSSSNTTNWMLSSHPELYLYTSLFHAAVFIRDAERIQLYGRLKDDYIKSHQLRHIKQRAGGSSRMISEVHAV